MDWTLETVEAFARCAHDGQFRRYSGVPYITHPIRVAERVSLMTSDNEVIAAAYLHDVVEDCNISFREIFDEFGENVGLYVWELTNPSKNSKASRAERKAIDRQHISKISAQAQMIKAIDRIDNLRDIAESDSDFRTLYGKESLSLATVLTKAPKELVYELMTLAAGMINTGENV